jgi:hypothetical protein
VNQLLKYGLKGGVKIPEELVEEVELVANGSFGGSVCRVQDRRIILPLSCDTEGIAKVSR